MGLSKSWNAPILCSEVTARLVARQLRLPTELLRPLPSDRPIDLAGGVRVTLRRDRGRDIDAACGQLANRKRASSK